MTGNLSPEAKKQISGMTPIFQRFFRNGVIQGLKEAEKIANWLHGQDRDRALKHIQGVREKLDNGGIEQA